MKLTLLLLCVFAAAGCAQTRVFENGKTVFATQANAQHLVYKSPAGSYLEITGLDHSNATLAQGTAAGKVLGGIGNVVLKTGTAISTSGLVKAVRP